MTEEADEEYYMWGEDWPFPDPRDFLDDSDEPVWVIGWELREESIWWAYHCGYFPWFSFRSEEIHWCGPTVRFVIKPEEIHVSHSMRNLINRNQYFVTFDTAFDEVIEKCSIGSHFEVARIERDGAWLGEEMIALYKQIFRSGGIGPDNYRIKARSVEVRDRETNEIVGGLYGLQAGHVFVGDSMFSLRPDTSKLALIALARHLAEEPEPHLIDCQMPTPHLKSMGATTMSFDTYLSYLWPENASGSPDPETPDYLPGDL